MTKEEARNLKQGDKVYIWGNKKKPQIVTWAGINNFGQRTDAVRFASGLFFCTEHDYEHIEFAPVDAICEQMDITTTEVLIRNGYGCDFYKIDVPLDNKRHQRVSFFQQNKIKVDKSGLLFTYNTELLKTLNKA